MSEKIICSICGARIAEGEYNYFDGQILCDDCLEQHTTVCDCCSTRIWNDHAEGDAYITLCYRCYENHYTTCEDVTPKYSPVFHHLSSYSKMK